ncbi:hypothetical protein QC334_34975 [Streptomyces sp. DH18]|uniref:hypothetical protein n=1 Tax=Streptomyces sp. DH18 TaxID=3040126 RepID=UPI0024416036|nr:hypothetical protein [Streptomyces sp. DH18]MDG9687875.1 hypothetical protein [Streptomyces sp. DH18]
MARYDFSQDLRDAQIALHQAQSEYDQYVRTLPWSAEPMPPPTGSSCWSSAPR